MLLLFTAAKPYSFLFSYHRNSTKPIVRFRRFPFLSAPQSSSSLARAREDSRSVRDSRTVDDSIVNDVGRTGGKPEIDRPQPSNCRLIEIRALEIPGHLSRLDDEARAAVEPSACWFRSHRFWQLGTEKKEKEKKLVIIQLKKGRPWHILWILLAFCYHPLIGLYNYCLRLRSLVVSKWFYCRPLLQPGFLVFFWRN